MLMLIPHWLAFAAVSVGREIFVTYNGILISWILDFLILPTTWTIFPSGFAKSNTVILLPIPEILDI